MKTQLQAKCEELNLFKQQHNIKVQGERNATEQEQTKEGKTSGILVAQTEK